MAILTNKFEPNYYAIIPANVRYDTRLKPNEKLLFGEIMALSQKNGYCYATNRYFAELYNVESETISRWINHLKKIGYIECKIVHDLDNNFDKRVIVPIDEKINVVLTETSNPPCENNQAPIDKKVKQNNIKENNTRENIKERNIKERFSKPTIEELEFYCKENSLKVDCNYFYDYYESNGWTVGKSKMKDWKATLRNWNRRNLKEENPDEIVSTEIINGVIYGISKKGDRWSMGVVNE